MTSFIVTQVVDGDVAMHIHITTTELDVRSRVSKALSRSLAGGSFYIELEDGTPVSTYHNGRWTHYTG